MLVSGRVQSFKSIRMYITWPKGQIRQRPGGLWTGSGSPRVFRTSDNKGSWVELSGTRGASNRYVISMYEKESKCRDKMLSPFLSIQPSTLEFCSLHPRKSNSSPLKIWLLEDYLLGWPTIRGEMLNFQAVYPMVCVVSLLKTTMKKPRGCSGCIGGGHVTLCHRV